MFIDDEEVPKVDALRNNGYNVFHWLDVESIPALDAGEFHVIFCDINGVGRKLSNEEGAGLIRTIKQQVRYPIVIAYSANSYQPGGRHEEVMRKIADDVIAKDAPVADYIACISRHGGEFFSVGRVTRILAESGAISESQAAQMLKSLWNSNPSKWQSIFEKFGVVGHGLSAWVPIIKLVIAFGL